MMKIVVCVKQVPESLVRNKNGEHVVERSGRGLVLNELDRYALELALRLKEKIGGEVITLSMGNINALSSLKEALAMGVDRAILLTDKLFAGSDTQATSYIISQAIRKIGSCNLVLCGRQSSDGDTAQVGPQLAEKLNMSLATNVSQVEAIEGDEIHCRRLIEGGYLDCIMQCPAVLTVNRSVGEPRIPTISGIIKADMQSIEQWDKNDIEVDNALCGLNGSPTKVIKVYESANSERKAVNIHGNTRDKAKKIVEIIRKSLKNTEKNQRNESINYFNNLTNRYVKNLELSKNEIWVYAEHKDGKVRDVVWEIVSKCNKICTCGKWKICLVTLKKLKEDDKKNIFYYGVDKVYTLGVDMLEYDILSQGRVLSEAIRKVRPEIVLLGATVCGRAIGPWVASRLLTGITADCIELGLDAVSETLIQIRPAFSGNLIAEIECPNIRPQMATIRHRIWEKEYCNNQKTVEFIYTSMTFENTYFYQEKKVYLNKGFNTYGSEFIIEGGRGVQTKENFKWIEKIAEEFNGSIGATRAAVDANLVDYDYQIGQTGVIVRPQVCVSVGISGALEHMVGIKEAKTLIAINKDEKAPIFDFSDYKVVSKAEELLPVIWKEIKEKMEDE